MTAAAAMQTVSNGINGIKWAAQSGIDDEEFVLKGPGVLEECEDGEGLGTTLDDAVQALKLTRKILSDL